MFQCKIDLLIGIETDCKGSSYLMGSIRLHGVIMVFMVETIMSKCKRYNTTRILDTLTQLLINTCFASMHDICIDLLIFLINR